MLYLTTSDSKRKPFANFYSKPKPNFQTDFRAYRLMVDGFKIESKRGLQITDPIEHVTCDAKV